MAVGIRAAVDPTRFGISIHLAIDGLSLLMVVLDRSPRRAGGALFVA
ncbi:hypothetical protein MJ575_20710 [Klebsiella pneumoniae]|nr:hypothetical protein MJ575_20710 [Klebsiella pneumoniae]